MYSFYGIIQTAASKSSSAGFEVLSQKFPTAFGGASRFDHAALRIMGDLHRSERPDGSVLWLCGELYGIGNNLQRQTEGVHDRIGQIGLAAAAAELNGRFMLCYLDGKQQTAHILTDHLATQQVLVHQGEGFLLFASEIRFLLQHPLCPRKIDWKNALRRSIPFEVLDGERNYGAWFQGINLLEEATELRIKLRNGLVEKHKYWQPYATQAAPNYRNADDVSDAYMALLEDAVRLRVQGAPTAYSFLSGGLDSSILCALAAREMPTESFSIITQTTLLEDTSPLCSQLARDLGFRNTQFAVPFHRLAPDAGLWKKRVWRAESPFAHTDSMTKTLLHDAIRRLHPHIGYTLTGTGSDQFNGGLARWIVEDAETPEASWTQMMEKVKEAERRTLLPERLFALWGARRFLQPDFVADIAGQAAEQNPWMYYVKSNVHINHFVLVWDENRAGYAHRHSVRYPFMDPRFLPFFAQVPQKFHAELFYDKQILRQPAARFLPDYILNKPKAPAFTGRYDRSLQIYQSLVNPQNLSLLEEALGPMDEPHPAIDKKALLAEMDRLIAQPDNKAWQYLLNVINLGLLEKLHEQDERSMGYEQDLQAVMDTISILDAPGTARLRLQFDIEPEADLLNRPLRFAEDCSLVTEHRSGKIYLNKKEVLAYEIEENERLWRDFLFAIDDERSTAQLLRDVQGEFDNIRDYFYLCLKEGILIV